MAGKKPILSQPKGVASEAASVLPAGYAGVLAGIKGRVRAAQLRAAVSVNRELIALYWDIGRAIVEQQRQHKWGDGVIDRLSRGLTRAFPTMAGFSRMSLYRMRMFFLAYAPADAIVAQPVLRLVGAEKLQHAVRELADPKLPQPVADSEIVAQLVRQLPDANLSQAVRESPGQELSRPVTEFLAAPPEPVASLPWGHNVLLMQKLPSLADRLWYARKAVEHGWSRAVLTHHIEAQLHKREGRAVTNFQRTLPPPQSDLAEQTLKDPYNFDFLTLGTEARERNLELGLLDHIQKFLLELGVGFAFVGRQFHLEVAGQDYSLDLLFYHLRLRCYVVIDLKMRAFEPEFAGKIHPVRYVTYVELPLCVRPAKPQGRQALHRLYQRSPPTVSRTPSRRGCINHHATPNGTHLLRGLLGPGRRDSKGKVSQERMGQALFEDASCRLSHGVNLYLSAVDDQLRHVDDKPSIGLLLCKERDRLTVEYALRDLRKPIGVAQWQTKLVESLPKNLKGSLPTIAEIEAELSKARK